MLSPIHIILNNSRSNNYNQVYPIPEVYFIIKRAVKR